MTYVPPSRRGDPSWGELREGVPDYLFNAFSGWVGRALRDAEGDLLDVLTTVQVYLQYNGMLANTSDLVALMEGDRDAAIDVADALLHLPGVATDHARRLDDVLTAGQSVWTVVPEDDGGHTLVRRGSGPISEVIENIGPESERSRRHLEIARRDLMGREPRSGYAYWHAVKAVEVAAKRVVTPNDPEATFGKMISALQDKPDKWELVLDGRRTADVLTMCKAIWTAEFDRHGDEARPLEVSEAQADAAFHIAMALVRIFRAEHLRRV